MPDWRILVAGSRDWSDADLIARHLDAAFDRAPAGRRMVVVHGGARGADRLAADHAAARGVATEAHPADWSRHGRRAGPIRNEAMIRSGIDECLVFAPDPPTPGSAHTLGRARAQGIPTRLITPGS